VDNDALYRSVEFYDDFNKLTINFVTFGGTTVPRIGELVYLPGQRTRDGSGAYRVPFMQIGLAISDSPKRGDEEFEQDGLRIFVEDTLIEPLEDRTLDVQEGDDGMRLVFR
jgi:hypothetical protein